MPSRKWNGAASGTAYGLIAFLHSPANRHLAENNKIGNEKKVTCGNFFMSLFV